MERFGDVPVGIVRFHFAEVAVIADVIAFAVLIGIGVAHRFAGILGDDVKCFEDGTTVVFPASQVIDFATARGLDKRPHEPGHIAGVNIVAHLLALVPKHRVRAAFHVALDQIAQKPVQCHAAVMGAGEASAAQATGGHAKITTVFLNQDIGSHFGRAKKRVLGLINGQGFRDAVVVRGVVVIVAGVQFP